HNCLSLYFFFSSRRRHTRFSRDWSSDVCSSDLVEAQTGRAMGSGSTAQASAILNLPTIGSLTSSKTIGFSWHHSDPRKSFSFEKIGRASCRERVYISVGGDPVNKNDIAMRIHIV